MVWSAGQRVAAVYTAAVLLACLAGVVIHGLDVGTGLAAIATMGLAVLVVWRELAVRSQTRAAQRDAAERAAAVEALQGAQRRLADIIEFMPDAVFVVDENRRIIAWNRACEAMTGTARDAVLGRSDFSKAFLGCERPTLFDMLDGSVPDVVQRCSYVRRQGQTIEAESFAPMLRDGKGAYVWGKVAPLFDRDGRRCGAIEVIRDVTEMKQAEETLRQARDAANHANHAKDEFLAKLSHELRTPLTPVLLAVSQWESQPSLPPSLCDDLAMVARNLELEARLVDDLLDVSRILHGKLSMQREVVDVHVRITDAAGIVADAARGAGLTVNLDLRADNPRIDGDPTRIEQVVWNLLNNAIKFTPRGGTITVSTSNDTSGQLIVRVTDTGMGIASPLLPRLFSPFEQGGHLANGRYGGLGLGLAICRSLIEMHGGSISAESPGPGQGSTFTLRLPIVDRPVVTPEPKPAAPSSRVRPDRQYRVLLVEDHPDTARLLARVLKAWGYQVRAAHGVREALAAAETEAFDLLVSDLGLPDGTGHDLIRKLSSRGKVLGIAISGYGMDEDHARSREAGFVAHLVKPVNLAEFRAAVEGALANAEAAV